MQKISHRWLCERLDVPACDDYRLGCATRDSNRQRPRWLCSLECGFLKKSEKTQKTKLCFLTFRIDVV